MFFRLLTPTLKATFTTIAITKTKRLGKLFRKRSDKMRKELEDAAREGSSRRSNSPVPAMLPNERTNSDLSDLTGAAKAAGFYSDGLPKNIHMKFVRIVNLQS